MNLYIKSLYSGGLITNYFCTSKCRHCLYNSSPYWPKEYITDKTTDRNLSIIKKLGVNTIHIGGGEPFLRIEKLKRVVKLVKSYNIHLEYIETNSSWFKDLKSTCKVLEEFYSIGLHTLLVSISPFHNEYIPFYKVQGVIRAAQEVGIDIFPWKQEFISDILKLDPNTTHSLDEFKSIFGDRYVSYVESNYWIIPGGRAIDTFKPFHRLMDIKELLESNRQKCYELENVSHFHVDLYENYIPGLCAGLAIKVEDLGKPIDPKKYPIISVLYDKGINGLYDFAKTYSFKPQKHGYWTKCELCNEIRFFLFNKDLDFLELAPSGYYKYGNK